MPRTKQVRKKSTMKSHKHNGSLASNESSSSLSSSASKSTAFSSLVAEDYESPKNFSEEFSIYYENMLKVHQEEYETTYNRILKLFADIKEGLPESTKELLVKNYVAENVAEDQNKDPNSTSASSSRQSRSRKVIESFDFKRPKTPSLFKSRSSSRKRSASVSSARKRSASVSSAPTSDIVKTPLMSSRKLPMGTTITPKIYSDTPMSVMRRPLHGEVAISMSGSPLMVGAVSREDIPTVNVPLGDGRVFSIMPALGAPPADLPGFDETTKQYLKTLRAHLEILAPNTP